MEKNRDSTRSVVSLSDVSLKIDGMPVLQDITWEVRRGENWVVVGPNGAGKTSLLRLLNGYHWPSSGTVRILGKSFGRVDLRELRKRIGLVSPYLTDWVREDENVLDAVLSGRFASVGLWVSPTRADRRLASTLLKWTGCARYASTRFGRLSQGEKQRIMIARALMPRPRLLALDEPCSGLDITGREKFLSALTAIALKRSTSMVYVTHRIEEIPRGFTHAMLMKGGRIIRKGKLDQALDDAGLTECFGVRIRVGRWGSRYYALVDG